MVANPLAGLTPGQEMLLTHRLVLSFCQGCQRDLSLYHLTRLLTKGKIALFRTLTSDSVEDFLTASRHVSVQPTSLLPRYAGMLPTRCLAMVGFPFLFYLTHCTNILPLPGSQDCSLPASLLDKISMGKITPETSSEVKKKSIYVNNVKGFVLPAQDTRLFLLYHLSSLYVIPFRLVHAADLGAEDEYLAKVFTASLRIVENVNHEILCLVIRIKGVGEHELITTTEGQTSLVPSKTPSLASFDNLNRQLTLLAQVAGLDETGEKDLFSWEGMCENNLDLAPLLSRPVGDCQDLDEDIVTVTED